MINLLPPENKKELLKEEQYKIVLILGIFVLLFLISFSLILFSIKIYVSSQLEAERVLLEQSQKEMKFSQIQELEGKVKSINQNLFKLDTFYQDQVALIKLFGEISEIFPSGVYLNTISVKSLEEKDNKFLVSLSGFSPSRELLIELENNIETKKSFFKNPVLPQSVWTKPTDIDFSLNFEI